VKRSSKWLAISTASAVFLISFALYLDTLAPTVLTFDSATLQTKANVLGIGYPTGYPAYIMLGKLFTYLPFGDAAYRVNLSSAVFGALASSGVYLISLRAMPGGRSFFTHGAAAAAALAFAVSPTFWTQAIQAEVYTLSVLFVTWTIYALLVWRDTGRESALLGATFLVGLSMTGHMTNGILIPAGLLFVFMVDRTKLMNVGLAAKSLGLFFLGLAPYLYIPIRASMDPPSNYSDATTLQGFWFILSGGNFKGQMFVFGPERLPERLEFYYGELIRQFPAVLLVLAVLGVIVLLFKDRPLAALLGTLMAGYLIFALEYGISDVYPYFIPTYLVLALLIGAGLGWLGGWLGRRAWIFSLPAGLAPAAMLVIASALVFVFVLDTHPEIDQSENYEARRVLEAVAENTASGAIVLGHRETAALRYMQLVESRRADLGIKTVTTRDVVKYTELALGRGPTYFVKPGATAVGNIREAGYDIYPVERGILYEVRPRKE
jgi:hypothetical protein